MDDHIAIAARREELRRVSAHPVLRRARRPRLALTAHAAKLGDLADWAARRLETLAECELLCTAEAGEAVADRCPELDLWFVKSERLGGMQQLCGMLAEERLDAVVAFIDPLSSATRDVDIGELIRLTALYDAPMACAPRAADCVLSGLLGELGRPESRPGAGLRVWSALSRPDPAPSRAAPSFEPAPERRSEPPAANPTPIAPEPPSPPTRSRPVSAGVSEGPIRWRGDVTRRLLMVVADGVDDAEAHGPLRALAALGHAVEIAAPGRRAGERVTTRRAESSGANAPRWSGGDLVLTLDFDAAAPSAFDGLVAPGGLSPDALRRDARALGLVRRFAEAHKPIGVIGRGAELLAAADAIRGRRLAAVADAAPAIQRAGGHYVENAGDDALSDGWVVSAPGWGAAAAWTRAFAVALA